MKEPISKRIEISPTTKKTGGYYRIEIGFWLDNADNETVLNDVTLDLDKRLNKALEQWQKVVKNVEIKNLEKEW